MKKTAMNKTAMKKTGFASCLSAVIAMSVVLSSCQLSNGYQQITEADSANSWSGKIYPVAGETNIACTGTYHCEIIRIDKMPIIAAKTHQPVDKAIIVNTLYQRDKPLTDKNSVKLVPLAASNMTGLINYYARVQPIKREVLIHFYPENNLDYVERFTIIHEFVAGTYQLRAYRMQPKQADSSLLANASPNPLCVELLQDGKIERRFCKQVDTERQGEFVETALFNATY